MHPELQKIVDIPTKKPNSLVQRWEVIMAKYKVGDTIHYMRTDLVVLHKVKFSPAVRNGERYTPAVKPVIITEYLDKNGVIQRKVLGPEYTVHFENRGRK